MAWVEADALLVPDTCPHHPTPPHPTSGLSCSAPSLVHIGPVHAHAVRTPPWPRLSCRHTAARQPCVHCLLLGLDALAAQVLPDPRTALERAARAPAPARPGPGPLAVGRLRLAVASRHHLPGASTTTGPQVTTQQRWQWQPLLPYRCAAALSC